MRKNLPIILLSALVVIGLLVGVGYYFQTYRHGKAPEEGLTVVTAESTTASNKRTLLAENKEGDFQLYAQGDKAILVHQGKSKTFSGWSRYLTKERPKLYYTDLNGDKKKELVVRLVSGIDRSTGQELYTYDLYVLTPHKQKNGSFEYDLVVANRESWKRPFTQAVKCSVTQLKNDPMRVQVAMGNASGSLSFDEKTGISTSKYTGFSRAETNTDGTPQTIYGWDYGIGTYTVEDGQIKVKIAVRIDYKPSRQIKIVGYTYCGLDYLGGGFSLKKGSVYYRAAQDCRITDPRDVAERDWVYTLTNASGTAGITEPQLSRVEGTFTVPDSGTDGVRSFSGMDSQIKAVSAVRFTNKQIVLTAAEGYSFMQNTANARDYAVQITRNKVTYRIDKSAEITEADGRSVLTFTLDKSYKRSDLQKVTLRFGA